MRKATVKPEQLVQALSRSQKTLVFLALDLALVPVALAFAILVQAAPVPALPAVLPLVPVLMLAAGLLSWRLGLPRVALNAYGHRAIALTAALAAALAVVAAVAAALIGPKLPAGSFVIFAAGYCLMFMALRMVLFHVVTWAWRRAAATTTETAPEPVAATGTAGTVLDRIDCPVTPGLVYDVSARFAGPFTPRSALARVRFEAADGTPVAPDPGTPRSAAVGAYRYLEVDDRPGRPRPDPNLGITGFLAPPGAVAMHVELIRWTGGRDLVVTQTAIGTHDTTASSLADGAAALPGGTWVMLAGTLTDMDRRDGALAVLRVEFTDAGGRPLTATAEGLTRTSRHNNVAVIAADALGPRPDADGKDGGHPVRVAFRPPPGARRMVWTLHPADAAARVGVAG
jgi:hypothetical protein